MSEWEYKVVAAPRRARRVRGLATPADRFAATLAETIAAEAQGGWEYLRAETLPFETRPGMLSARVETMQGLLVFRRPRARLKVEEPVRMPVLRAVEPVPDLPPVRLPAADPGEDRKG